MAYSDNFPATRPVFMADFANGGKIDPRATFSRASTGTYFGTEKVLSSENLLLQSEDFTTSWSSLDMTGSAGATAPDGGTDAYTLTASTGSGQEPRIFQSLSGKLSTSTQYTMVGHVKAGTATHGWISFRGNSGNNYAYAQIEFASPSSVSTGGAGFTGISGTVTALGSSWYRLTLTATTGSDVSGAYAFFGPNDGSAFGISGYPAWTTAGETLEVWGAQISSTNTKIYDSPTTTQIARSYQTKLQTAASGAARFEHSASDGQSMGILIEGQSTNLLAGSATIGGSYWGVANATAQQNSAVAPDGTLTATTLVENSAGGAKYAYSNSYTPAASTTYTFSAFVKPNGRNFCLIYTNFGGANQSSMFDLGTGATSNLSGSGVNTAAQCGNGWWRLSVTVTTTSTTTANFQILPATDATTFDYTGNGYSGLLCWGAMLEQSSFASSYIGTTSSAVTRAADSAAIAVSEITGFSEGVGTVVYETGGVSSATANSQAAFSLYSSTLANNYTMAGVNVGGASDTSVRVYVKTPAGDQSFFSTGTVSVGDSYKLACRYELDNVAASLNGGAVVSDSSGTVPVGVDTLAFGQRDGTNYLNSNLKRIAIYGEALSDTNLQALTS